MTSTLPVVAVALVVVELSPAAPASPPLVLEVLEVPPTPVIPVEPPVVVAVACPFGTHWLFTQSCVALQSDGVEHRHTAVPVSQALTCPSPPLSQAPKSKKAPQTTPNASALRPIETSSMITNVLPRIQRDPLVTSGVRRFQVLRPSK